MASSLRKRRKGGAGVRCSLWQHRNAAKRVERGRTSIVAGVRADVVLERKRQGCGSTVGGDGSLRRPTEQRTRVKRATTGRRVVDGGRAHRDPGQLPLVACGQVMANLVRTWPTAVLFWNVIATVFELNVLLVTLIVSGVGVSVGVA